MFRNFLRSRTPVTLIQHFPSLFGYGIPPHFFFVCYLLTTYLNTLEGLPHTILHRSKSPKNSNMEKLLTNFPCGLERASAHQLSKGPQSGFFLMVPLHVIYSLNWEEETKDPCATLYNRLYTVGTSIRRNKTRLSATQDIFCNSPATCNSAFIEHLLVCSAARTQRWVKWLLFQRSLLLSRGKKTALQIQITQALLVLRVFSTVRPTLGFTTLRLQHSQRGVSRSLRI